jgi:hypothetical protein
MFWQNFRQHKLSGDRTHFNLRLVDFNAISTAVMTRKYSGSQLGVIKEGYCTAGITPRFDRLLKKLND